MVTVNLENLVKLSDKEEPPDGITVKGFICGIFGDNAFGLTSSKPGKEVNNLVKCVFNTPPVNSLKEDLAILAHMYNKPEAYGIVRPVEVIGKYFKPLGNNGSKKLIPVINGVSSVEYTNKEY